MKNLNISSFIQNLHEKIEQELKKEKILPLEDFKRLKGKKLRILILDDEDIIRDLIQKYFTRKDCIVSTAKDPIELLHLIEQTLFDVLLIDIHLPWINGLELAKQLRSDSILYNLPLIFISGNLSDIDKKKAKDMSALCFTKPLDLKELEKAIFQVTDHVTKETS